MPTGKTSSVSPLKLYPAQVNTADVVRVSGSDVGDRELDAIAGVFRRGYLGMGSEVVAFEDALATRFKRQVACVATGTAALQLAIQAAEIGPGDEVIVPTLTYVAACQAVSATGATPVLADVLPDTLTLDPSSVEQRITGRTRALLPTHYAGGIGQLSALYAIAERTGLRVIEDAAHAFGSSDGSGEVGSTGDVVCFSFDPIKNLTSGEGGCVVSNDESLISRVRDLRLLGVQGDSKARARETRLYEFDVVDQGWRFHMSNICAAIGLAQLETFPTRARQRQALAKTYNGEFANNRRITTLPWNFDEIVPHIYVIMLPQRAQRDWVRSRLAEARVQTGLHWLPNHRLTRFADAADRFPVAEDAFERMLTLPLHTRLSQEDVRRIAAIVQEVLADADPEMPSTSLA